MYRLSGVTIVMAGLAGSGLLYAVWSWDTTPFRAMSPTISRPEAQPNLGSALVLHSGAWRTWPAEGGPSPVASDAPTPPQAASLPTTDLTLRLPAPSVRTFTFKAPQTPSVPQAAQEAASAPAAEAAPVEPAVQPMATPLEPALPLPAPRNRMSLAGPKAEDTARHAPRLESGERPQAQQPEAALQAPVPKFGVEVFRKLDGVGF